jgi:hypothetical protein
MNSRTRLVAALAVALAGLSTAMTALAGGVAGAPASAALPKPADEFSARVDNPWYPLKPGTVYVYRGVKDGKPALDVMTVTKRVKTIAGVPCVVIQDRLYLSGKLHERTTDWYSQDRQGNVWYFGEATAELGKNGKIASTEGSFQAGRNGARPGIFMTARPSVGYSAKQESYKGHAEDYFAVVSLLPTALRLPTATAKHVLLTKEWTPLEPGVLDHKVYVRGLGLVVEMSVKGGNERLELVSVRHVS